MGHALRVYMTPGATHTRPQGIVPGTFVILIVAK